MYRSNINPDTKGKISKALGKDIALFGEGSTESFADFSESDLDDLRKLEKKGGVLAVSYIKYRLKIRAELNLIVAFYASVIQQGIPLDEWVNNNKARIERERVD